MSQEEVSEKLKIVKQFINEFPKYSEEHKETVLSKLRVCCEKQGLEKYPRVVLETYDKPKEEVFGEGIVLFDFKIF